MKRDVLISAGYGAGWSTGAVGMASRVFLLFDQGLVQMVRDGIPFDEAADYILKHVEEGYYVSESAYRDLVVSQVEEGTKFTVTEYDGWETLITENELEYTA